MSSNHIRAMWIFFSPDQLLLLLRAWSGKGPLGSLGPHSRALSTSWMRNITCAKSLVLTDRDNHNSTRSLRPCGVVLNPKLISTAALVVILVMLYHCIVKLVCILCGLSCLLSCRPRSQWDSSDRSIQYRRAHSGGLMDGRS